MRQTLATFTLAVLAGTAVAADDGALAASNPFNNPDRFIGIAPAVGAASDDLADLLEEDEAFDPDEKEWFFKVLRAFMEYRAAYDAKLSAVENTDGQDQLPLLPRLERVKRLKQKVYWDLLAQYRAHLAQFGWAEIQEPLLMQRLTMSAEDVTSKGHDHDAAGVTRAYSDNLFKVLALTQEASDLVIEQNSLNIFDVTKGEVGEVMEELLEAAAVFSKTGNEHDHSLVWRNSVDVQTNIERLQRQIAINDAKIIELDKMSPLSLKIAELTKMIPIAEAKMDSDQKQFALYVRKVTFEEKNKSALINFEAQEFQRMSQRKIAEAEEEGFLTVAQDAFIQAQAMKLNALSASWKAHALDLNAGWRMQNLADSQKLIEETDVPELEKSSDFQQEILRQVLHKYKLAYMRSSHLASTNQDLTTINTERLHQIWASDKRLEGRGEPEIGGW